VSDATAHKFTPKHCAQWFVKHPFVAPFLPPLNNLLEGRTLGGLSSLSRCTEVPTKWLGSDTEGANPHAYLAPNVVYDTLLCSLSKALRVALKGVLEASLLSRVAILSCCTEVSAK
jgi:hypothetical protein